jgi:hypothetical protein
VTTRRTALCSLAAYVAASPLSRSRDIPVAQPHADESGVIPLSHPLAQHLVARDREWAKAVVQRERSSVAEFLHPAFVATDATGHLWDHARYLAAISTDLSGLISIESDEYEICLLGEAAVVRGRLIYNSTRPDLTGPHRFTKTFVRHKGQWCCASLHEGRILE